MAGFSLLQTWRFLTVPVCYAKLFVFVRSERSKRYSRPPKNATQSKYTHVKQVQCHCEHLGIRFAIGLYPALSWGVPTIEPHPNLPFKDDDFALDPKDWIPALILQADLERELAEKRHHLLRRLSTWYLLISIFRRLERDKMVATEATARDSKYHRAMLEFLIGSGSILVLELEAHKQIDPIHIGIPFESVSAQLQELRDDLRMWYGGMTTERRNEILGDVFGVTQ